MYANSLPLASETDGMHRIYRGPSAVLTHLPASLYLTNAKGSSTFAFLDAALFTLAHRILDHPDTILRPTPLITDRLALTVEGGRLGSRVRLLHSPSLANGQFPPLVLSQDSLGSLRQEFRSELSGFRQEWNSVLQARKSGVVRRKESLAKFFLI